MHCHRFIVAVGLWCLLSAVAAAQNPEPLGGPPQFVQIGKVDREAGQVEVLMTFFKTVYETKQETFVENGVEKTRTFAVPRTVSEMAMQPIRLDDVRIVTAGKERLEPAAALERLRPGMIILRHTWGTKFDARYLSVLSPDAIIFIEKPIARVMPMPAAPVGPAAPAPSVAPPVPAPATAP